jgi:putative heme-binding domain-containing protein
MRAWCVVGALAMILFHGAISGAQPGKQKDPNIADTDPLTPQEQLKKFHLPPGFAIQLVAAEPMIKKPINIAFDAKGRLWVTGSEEYPFPAPPNRKGKDTVRILEDFAPDGLARKMTVFADGLNIPIGVLPMPDCKSALVYSIPSIWKLTDTDGDGKADKKEELYTGYGYRDTHGMTGEFMWGFDGWVYCCHGYLNTSTVKAKDGSQITMTSGNTYRIKPDGSRIEQYTWGQVNPFGLCFDPLGNLYSADCHSRPLYQLLKGAYYPSFGRAHDGLGFGPEMVTHDHGSTAIAGIVYYAADHFPKEYHDNIFVGNVVTNRINRDRIEWHGSTPKGIEMPDFVKCDDPWFRPVDIKLGPDGALYVADFYNRIIGHYEVPLNHPGRDREKGRIWRIVYVGEDGKGKPKEYSAVTERTTEGLVASLGDLNLTVRTFATNELAGRPVLEVRRAIGNGKEPLAGVRAVHTMWLLERMGAGPRFTDMPKASHAAHNPDRMEAVQFARILSERKSLSEREGEALRIFLKDGDPFIQRAAAETLGNHPDSANVYALLAIRHKAPPDDAQLVHAIRMALRDQLRHPEVAKFINQAAFQKAGDLEALADVCLGMPSPPAAEFVLHYGLTRTDRAQLWQERVHHVARFGAEDIRSALLDKVGEISLKNPGLSAAAVKGILQGTQERGGQLNPAERGWAEQTVKRLLKSSKPKVLQDGIELAGSMKIYSAEPYLIAIATNPDYPEDQRKSAIAAVVIVEPKHHIDTLAHLLVHDAEKIGVREQIASSLAGVNQPEAYTALVQAFEKAPARLQTTIALGMAGSPQGGNKLLDAVAAGKASARLLQDRAIELKLRQAKVVNLDKRLAMLTKGLPAADQRAQELIGKRKAAFATAKTDAMEGRKIFEKHCANCHIIANQGAKIGPQLDGVGIRGLERLLEDILDPSRNVDQAFRSTTLELENGQFITGLLLREEGKVFVMANNEGKEVRVQGSQVVNRTVGQLSPMPANFAEQVSEKDFHNLMAFLLAQKVK